MKIRKKWLLIGLASLTLAVLVWFLLPAILKGYINQLKPGVRVDAVKLLNLDCVRLNGIHVSLQDPAISGNFHSAVACRRAKTIDIEGGVVRMSLLRGEGKDSKGDSSFQIKAKGLTIYLQVAEGTYANLNQVTVDPQKVCGRDAQVDDKRVGQLSLIGFCVDRKSRIMTFTGGGVRPYSVEAIPALREFGGLGEVTFHAGTLDTTNKRLELSSVHRKPLTASGVSVELKDGLIYSKAQSLTVEHKRLYTGPVTLQDVEFSPIDPKNPTKGQPLDKGAVWVRVNSKGEGPARGVTVYLDWKDQRVWGVALCQRWFDALPVELKIDPLPQVKLKGDFYFSVQLKPEVKLKISNTCKIEGSTPKFIRDLEGKFTYTAYHPDGKPFTRETGSSTAGWVPYQLVSPNMTTALTTTEDPGFFLHRGFIPQAIENSLKDNLKLGRFFRGGSTLTMQLAKNLWLVRNRTIGRKIQEAILTVALESTLSKERIIELYLNIVEFGPDLYGIGPASVQLLHKEPMEISLSEAVYLVLRLPRPNNSANYEQAKGMIRKLLDNIAAAGKVPADLIEVEKSALDTSQLVTMDD